MDVLIIGAGGHGKVVLEILRSTRGIRVAGFLDADESLAGKSVSGVKVLGPVNLLPKLKRKKIRQVCVAIGDNRTRLQYMNAARESGFELISAVHPRAIVSKTARIGRNVVLAAGSVVCAEAQIDDGAIINTAAVIDHECTVGAAAHICPTAALAGRVRVGDGAFIGLGAKIIQCLTVGAWATVGAGAVVIADLADSAKAVGVPARIIK